MENSRLFELLQTLSPTEKRAFRKYLQSPFFNQRQDVLQLFDWWEKTCSGTSRGRSDKQTVFAAVFGTGEPYDDHKVRLAMSLLFKLAEDFITYETVFADETQTRIRLMQAYRRRSLPRHFSRLAEQVKQRHEQQPLKDPTHLWSGYEIQLEEYLFSASLQRTAELRIQELGDKLDLAFIALKMRQTCAALSHQAVFKADYDLGLLQAVLHSIEAGRLWQQPAIGMYYFCYLALTQPDNPERFQQFKKTLFEYESALPPAEVRDLYLLGINFCIQRYNSGDTGFLAEEFELYRAGLEKRLLLVNGVLSRFTYRNVITIGIVLKEFVWVEHFLHDFRDLLEGRHREANFSFNLARLEYERGQYDKALELLQKSDYEDILLNLAAKTVLLKIYYETEQFDPLQSHLDAMSNFVRRHKELGYHRNHYLHLCRFTRKLLSLPPSERKGAQALYEQVNRQPNVAERSWLLQKIREMLPG